MKRRGFTITELLIIIAVLGILLTLGAVNLRGAQASARDEERRGDIESISIHLENFYTSGSDDLPGGNYPSTAFIGEGEESIRSVLRDIHPNSLRAPGVASPDISLVAASNNNSTNPEAIVPYPSVDEYVYQPLKSDGSLCTLVTDACRKFNIYYFLESATSVQFVTSRNQ